MLSSGYAWWLPVDVSKTQGAAIDQLIVILHVFMAVLFVGWGIFFAYCLVRFRQKSGGAASPDPIAAKPSKYAEIAVAIFEVFLLLGLSTPVLAKVKNQFPPEAQSEVVRVIAEQFAWNAHYAGPDGQFGRTNPRLIDAGNLIGLDRNDPHAKDDLVTLNEMAVPVDKPVIVRLSSKDVIHCYAVPVLRVKQDVIPGMTIPIWFEAAKTGDFDIQCAQLCGNNHFKMKGTISIKTASEYEAWKQSRAPKEIKVDEEEFES